MAETAGVAGEQAPMPVPAAPKLTDAVLKPAKNLFRDLQAKHGWSDVTSLDEFLSKVQKETVSEKQKSQNLTFENFVEYLSTWAANAVTPAPEVDLSLPMSNYFINSSHNTYLTGNQLSSESSIEGYKNVLRRGCRCVEIDVWDGKPGDEDEDSGELDKENRHGSLRNALRGLGLRSRKNSKDKAGASEPATRSDSTNSIRPWRSNSIKRVEPRVLHGYTLTKEVPFRDVCQAIRETAFETSDLPVIISFEIHTNLEQQERMVEIISEEWNGFLIHDDPAHAVSLDADAQNGANGADGKPAPAPQDLRNKILIKIKYSSPEAAKASPEISKDEARRKEMERTNSSPPSSGDEPEKDEKPKKKKILDALSQLGVYTRSYSFKNFDQPEAKTPHHIFSLSESTFEEVHQNCASDLFAHNKHFLMRAYPKGMRISSSNLNPAFYWRQGVQIAALNWQTVDKGIMLNQAMFDGTQGWVTKPEAWRSSHQRVVAPPRNKLLTLSIEFIAAQNLPLPPDEDDERSFRPYVKVELHAEALELRQRSRSRSLGGRPPRENHALGGGRSSGAAVGGGSGEGTASAAGGGGSSTPSTGASPPTNTNDTNTNHMERKTSLLHRTRSRSRSGSGGAKSGALKAHTATHHGTRSPDFQRETVTFCDVAVDEEALSFVRLKVMDDRPLRGDDVAAWACVRLDRLREGVRFLRLFDTKGDLSGGTLLVRIENRVRDGSGGGLGAGLLAPRAA